MSEYKEFWIDNSNETNKDFFLYNVKRGVMNYNFQGAIHVIEYSAYEQANERIKELEREIEKLKSTLVETKNKIIEAELQNNDRCWFNVEIILRQLVDSISEVLK